MTDDRVGYSPIEEFLDQLLVASVDARPRATRHLLAETEAHLRDAADAAMAAGATSAEAEETAVARFGSVEALVQAEAAGRAIPIAALIRPAVGTTLLIGGLGGLAMGVSALITAVMGFFAGSTFIVNISHHTYLAPTDCARWLSQNHSTHSCYQAALEDWSFEVVAYRAVLGVLGVMALLAYSRLRRRWSARQLTFNLPRSPVDAAAFLVFAGAGVWLAGLGIDALIVSAGRGAGVGLGTAPAMLVLGVVFGRRLISDLRGMPDRVPARV
ncbi:MAG TPA: permease prefix domain 1-containing protein [Acidimicrobiales bacterium]